MPELGEVRHLGDGARVWTRMWGLDARTKQYTVLPPRWVSLKAHDSEIQDALDDLALLPDGAIVDLEMLQQGRLVVLSKPEDGAKLSDTAMAWLEGEAEVAGAMECR